MCTKSAEAKEHLYVELWLNFIIQTIYFNVGGGDGAVIFSCAFLSPDESNEKQHQRRKKDNHLFDDRIKDEKQTFHSHSCQQQKPTNNWDRQVKHKNWFVQYFCTWLHKNISALVFVVSFIFFHWLLCFVFGYLFQLQLPPRPATSSTRNILFQFSLQTLPPLFSGRNQIYSFRILFALRWFFSSLCSDKEETVNCVIFCVLFTRKESERKKIKLK